MALAQGGGFLRVFGIVYLIRAARERRRRRREEREEAGRD